MIGTTRLELVRMLKAELGQTLNAASASQDVPALGQLLSNTQLMLAAEHDWAFLRNRWDVAVATRYADLPVQRGVLAIDFSRPVLVEVYFNGTWQPVDYGIGAAEFNYKDSGNNETIDPIQRWQFYKSVVEDEEPKNQFEVWPIPASSQTVRFTGQRVVLPLGEDADKCDLDDLLIVLTTAAQKLAATEPRKSAAKAQLAAERLIRLKAASPSYDEPVVLGQNRLKGVEKRLVPVVIVR